MRNISSMNHHKRWHFDKSKISPWNVYWYLVVQSRWSLLVLWISFFPQLLQDFDVNIYHWNRSLYVDKRRSLLFQWTGRPRFFLFPTKHSTSRNYFVAPVCFFPCPHPHSPYKVHVKQSHAGILYSRIHQYNS